MNRAKLNILILIIFCITVFCGGCNIAENKNITVITKNDDNTIVLGAGRHLAPGEKDGYYCSKTLEVWEPLITHDENGLPKPCLASKWKMLDNGKVWIFNLREDVNFHDGSKFNADSVIKNFDRMKQGVKQSSFYGLDINSFYPSLDKYEKLDDYTIRLTFREPNVNQLYKMMDFGSPIYSPNCFSEDGNFNGFAIGTGPYKIIENKLNKYVVLQKFDGYYGKKAKIKQIVIKNIPNADVRYSALKSEEIAGVLDLNAIPPFLAEEIKKDYRFAVSTNKSTMVRFLALNGSKFPFNDVRMRQAVSLAINRDMLVKALYLGYGYPTTNILNYTSPYYKDFQVSYNLDKAKTLAESVLGDKRCEIVYCINGADQLQKGEAELIAYWLKDIGLDVIIQPLEYATMVKQVKKGDYNISRLQQGLPNGDPYNIFYTFMMPDGSRNKNCSLGYHNAEVISLMNKVRYTENEIARSVIYDRLQEIGVKEQPLVPLFYDLNIVAYNKKLLNYNVLYYGVDLAAIELVNM